MADTMINFQLVQFGKVVAEASAPDFDDAWREICHYAAVYSQDGPVMIQEVIDADIENAMAALVEADIFGCHSLEELKPTAAEE